MHLTIHCEQSLDLLAGHGSCVGGPPLSISVMCDGIS